MEVPKGGSSCKICRYVTKDLHHCGNKHVVAWSVPECTAFLFARTAENLAYLLESSCAILDRNGCRCIAIITNVVGFLRMRDASPQRRLLLHILE
jgi:hypothetical protein